MPLRYKAALSRLPAQTKFIPLKGVLKRVPLRCELYPAHVLPVWFALIGALLLKRYHEWLTGLYIKIQPKIRERSKAA
jgi:hypothetical protein